MSRARVQKHVDDAAGTAADICDTLAFDVRDWKQRLHNVGEQACGSVISLVVAIPRPLFSEIQDSLLL